MIFFDMIFDFRIVLKLKFVSDIDYLKESSAVVTCFTTDIFYSSTVCAAVLHIMVVRYAIYFTKHINV